MSTTNPHTKRLWILRAVLFEVMIASCAIAISPLCGNVNEILPTFYGLFVAFNAIAAAVGVIVLLQLSVAKAEKKRDDYEIEHNPRKGTK